MSLVSKLQAATGKKSFFDIFKKAGVSIVLDGNWGEAALQLSGVLQQATWCMAYIGAVVARCHRTLLPRLHPYRQPISARCGPCAAADT